MLMININNRRVFTIILMLIVLTPLGFYTKIYQGPGQDWVNFSFCDSLYEIFWCLVFSLFLPRVRLIWIAVAVFVLTSILEVMQLWHPPILQAIRGTLLGRTLIGNDFIWTDFIYYFIGCVAGFYILKAIDRKKPD